MEVKDKKSTVVGGGDVLDRVMEDSVLHRIEVGGGRVCVEDSGGAGEVIFCLPSLGDLRQEYRFLAPRLRVQGYRVLVADLRGHGDSDAGFERYRPEDLGADILAVLDGLKIDAAHLIGCSISAAAISWVSLHAPARVSSLVMLGGIVRDLPADRFFRPLSHLLFARPWGAALWGMFFRKLLPGNPPQDLDEYIAVLKANLREPGRLEALGQMARASKMEIFGRFSEIQTPALALFGSLDPDTPDNAKELEIIKDALGGPTETALLDGLGHYPHVEEPQLVLDHILPFLKREVL